MDDNKKKVHDAVEEVGRGRTGDKKVLVKGLDRLAEHIQGIRMRIEADEIGPLGMLIEEFRDIRPHYAFGELIPKGVDQFGPSVTKITILDWKNERKTFS